MSTDTTTTDTTAEGDAAPLRTVAALGAAVQAELDDTYTLVYTEQGQTLDDDVVNALVKGENPWETPGGDRLMEREGEVMHTAASEAVDELARAIVNRWEREDDADYDELLEDEWSVSDERDDAIREVRDRDRSRWYDDLINGHGKVLLRVGIPAMDEDAGLSFTPMTPHRFLDLLRFEHTPHNLKLAEEVVANASPEHSVVMGYALLGVELADVVGLPESGRVELRDFHVWLGSPFAGSGWCGEEAFTGALVVDRDDLRTDEDAFGYSWGQVVGGTSPSHYGGGIAAVAEPVACMPVEFPDRQTFLAALRAMGTDYPDHYGEVVALPEGFTHAGFAAAVGIELPEEDYGTGTVYFDPRVIYLGVDCSIPGNRGEDHEPDEGDVVYDGAELFCLGCEAHGEALPGHDRPWPTHRQVQEWHDSL